MVKVSPALPVSVTPVTTGDPPEAYKKMATTTISSGDALGWTVSVPDPDAPPAFVA